MELAKQQKPFNPSWFLVCVMLSMFWPVGLYFLWAKVQNMNAPTPEKPRKQGIFTGGVAMMLGALALWQMEIIPPAWMLFMLVGGGAMFYLNQMQKKRDKRLARYVAIVGDHRTMSIMNIAGTMGVSYDTACNDLQMMIDDHYFSKHAYLDLGAGLFVAHSKYAPAQDETEAPRATTSRAPSAAPTKAAPVKKPSETVDNEYVNWLTQIRKVNDAIEDEKLSDQISEIEQYTANIFECVVQRPEKRREINTFMNYYLPTTLKLLDAYARLEKQNVSGGAIESSKKNIETMVEQLVWAFRRQNDQMFQSEAMDISSDIKVMETMLAKDGLSDSAMGMNSPFSAAVQKKAQ